MSRVCQPREQIISARRIVFRRNLSSNDKQQQEQKPEQHQPNIQKVRSVMTQEQFKHFEAKKKTLVLQQQQQQQQQQEEPLQWSRCKQVAENPKENPLKINGDDFRAYQNGNLHQFLDDNSNRRVADVCLVNDHFILVKMPQSKKQSSASEIECIIEHVQQRVVSPQKQQKQHQQLISIVKPERNGRIRPQATNQLNNIQTVKEIRPSCKVPTALRHIHWKTDLKEQQSIVEEEPIEQQQQQHQEPMKVKRKDSPMPRRQLPFNLFRAAQTVQESVPKSKTVNFQNHGELICPEETNNNNINYVSNCNKNGTSLSKQKNGALRAFNWLINPFCARLKQRKRQKAKPKIQAVIYKTYFVRWTKPSDLNWRRSMEGNTPDAVEQENKKLRRVRSAMF